MTDTRRTDAQCEHHWISKHQPDFPHPIYWVDVCSLCGNINGERLAEELRSVAAEAEVIEPPDVDNDNAVAWAESFVSHAKRNPALAMDVGAMSGWFANARQMAVMQLHDAYDQGFRDASARLAYTEEGEHHDQ